MSLLYSEVVERNRWLRNELRHGLISCAGEIFGAELLKAFLVAGLSEQLIIESPPMRELVKLSEEEYRKRAERFDDKIPAEESKAEAEFILEKHRARSAFYPNKDRESTSSELRKIAKEFDDYKAETKARCNHRKENGVTRLGGQLFSDQLVHLFCSFCGKEFIEPNIPKELMPPLEMIGGWGERPIETI